MKFSKITDHIIKPFFVIYFVATVLLLVLYSCLDDSGHANNEGQTFINEWSVTDPEGNVFTAGNTYRSERPLKGNYTMVSKLPDDIRDGENLCMVIGGDAQIYIDGKLRKEFSATGDFSLPGGIVKRFYMLTPLTKADSGKEVILIRLGASKRGYVYQHTFLATSAGLYSFMFTHYGVSFILAEVLLIFSLVIVIISVVMRFMYRHQIEMLYGSMAIFVISAWLITNSYLYPFVFGHYHIDGLVNYLFCLMMPFNLVFYLEALQHGRFRKITASALIIGVISCIIWPTLHFLGIFSLSDALPYIDAILGVQVLAALGVLFYDAVKGNIREYGYTAIGFAGFMVCGIFEIMILNFTPIMQDDIPILVGLAFLLTLSVIQQIHDLKEMREEGQRAADLSAAKTRFLAGMSHEIRTPINAVLGMNEMIIRENRDPVIDEYAKSVKSSGQMLLMLVNDVLDFSRIEAGMMEITEAPYSLSALLKGILPMLLERAGEKNLKLETRVEGFVPDGQISDEFRIRQILINIVNNAIKYTDVGSVILSVGGDLIADNRFMLRFSVKDTGRGISEEGQKHLFEAFSRADIKKNRNIEGTGLGLAIVKSILDSMGGDISVYSKEGEGSEFTVNIPVAISDDTPVKEDFMKQGAKSTPEKDRCAFTAPQAKILIVDDNRSNLKLVSLLLKRSQITPDTCDSGRKAIEMCGSVRYDLILLDHMMPELDGVETLQQIRNDRHSLNRDVPVIVLTANAVAGSRQVYIDAGFTDYLTKPVDAVLLEQTIRRYLPADKILPADR